MSTETNKSSTGSIPLSTPASISQLDNRPRVSELINFYELLTKGQLEESLKLHDTDTETIRKIRNVQNFEGLKRASEEDPILLLKLREAAKGILRIRHNARALFILSL